MSTIAFIGLGNMGLPMAINLKNAEFEVVGFDVVDSAREAAVNAGINVSDNARSAVQDRRCHSNHATQRCHRKKCCF